MDKPLSDLPIPKYTQKVELEPKKIKPKTGKKQKYLDEILDPSKLKEYFASKK